MKRVEVVLFFLTLLFLPTQLGRHFWPDFSFVYSLKIDYLSPTIYFWDLLVILLWTVFLLEKKHINRLALNLFYFFIFTQALSLLPNSASIGAGLVRLEQYLIAGLFGVYVASSKFKVQSAKLYWPLGLAVIGESILAILQFIKGGTLGLWILGERSFSASTPGIAKFDFYGREFLRPYATFPHPNVLAAFLVITIPMLWFINIKKNNWLAYFASVLGGLATVLTMGRISLIVGFLEALIFIRGKFLLLAIVLIFLISPFLYIRFSNIFSFDNLTLVRREELFGEGIKIWLSSPGLGIGLNNFIPAAASGLVSGSSRFLQPAHNIFLLTLSETGVVGLLGLITLIGYPLYKNKVFASFAYRKKLLIVWVSIIFLGLFDHYFLTLPQGYRLLFLVWGLSLSRSA